jgi:NAD(P)-dependent dehydrogenase (short-subunit alcohol dehydrogenase family)
MKTILITGTNHGLGLALTKAALAAGWKVIAVARTAPEIPSSPNLQVELCDLSSDPALQALLLKLQNVPIDVLVNNAAVYDAGSVDDDKATTDYETLANVFRVNVVAPKLLADGLVANLQAGQEKLIVTISSGMGTYAEFEEYHAEHWAYSASKAAVNYAMISFAALHKDLKSCLVNPGWMQTTMGGKDATIPPEESAANILDLITNHQTKLPNAKMVDHLGEAMEL